MRKIMIAALLAATLPSLALAMPDGQPHPRDGKRIFHEQLELTGEQKYEMHRLMGNQYKAHRAVTQKYLNKLTHAERESMQQELDAIRDQSQKEMRDLLTPDQQLKYDDIQAALAARNDQPEGR